MTDDDGVLRYGDGWGAQLALALEADPPTLRLSDGRHSVSFDLAGLLRHHRREVALALCPELDPKLSPVLPADEATEHPGLRPSFPKVSMLEDGLVWALNRYVLHPEGLALAADTKTGALTVMRADDGIWSYEPETDRYGRERFRRFLRWHGVRPPDLDR